MLLLSKLLALLLGSELAVSLASAALLLVALRAAQYLLWLRSLPPGPWGIPFLGFLPFLSGVPHVQFTELRSKYGPTFSARLGSQLLVVLSDYKSIRKAFRKEAFSGRPENEISAIIEGYGVVNVDGALWKEQRKFLHEQLRKFGMKQVGSGKEELEGRIMEEVSHFLGDVWGDEGKAGVLNLNNILTLSFSNVICSLLMNVRFSKNDPRFKRFMGLIEEGFQLCTATGASNFIPCLRNLPRLQALNVKIQANREEMSGFFRDIVELHKETFDPSNIRDVVDTYLLEIEIAKQEGRELFQGKDPDRQIYQILGDLYSAGMETTKTTMNWAVLYMLHYPQILAKVQSELAQVVGPHRLPSLEDLTSLPYTEATLLEVFRRACIVPLGTTHSTTTDVMLDGFLIPKNSQVMPLIYAVHMDPSLWDEPEAFNPSRFLSPEGKVVKPEFFIPFGTGRRMCLGDVLARHQLFLFFSSLVHVFELKPVEGEPLPDLVGKSAVTIIPDEYQICVTPRHSSLIPHQSQPVNPKLLVEKNRAFGLH